MKNLLILSLFSIILFLGCNQETEITSPADNLDNQQYKLIPLPANSSGLNIETLYTQSKDINGKYGGDFNADFSYQGGPFGLVTVESDLDFSPYSFQGTVNISQTLDSDYAVVSFAPSMQFYVPVEYDLKITGLDLSNVNPATLEFVYIANDGTIYNCEYDSMTMDVSTGTIIVDDAELEHFSRYGFVN